MFGSAASLHISSSEYFKVSCRSKFYIHSASLRRFSFIQVKTLTRGPGRPSPHTKILARGTWTAGQASYSPDCPGGKNLSLGVRLHRKRTCMYFFSIVLWLNACCWYNMKTHMHNVVLLLLFDTSLGP